MGLLLLEVMAVLCLPALCASQQNTTDSIIDCASQILDDIPITNVYPQNTCTPETIQDTLCPFRCNGTERVGDFNVVSCFRCFPCNCHPACTLDGTCCPGLGDEWSSPPVDRVRCKHLFNTKDDNIMYIDSCLPRFPLGATRQLCDSANSLPRRRDTHLPVTSTDTFITYANKYCAQCNLDGVNTAEWTMGCIHNQFLYDVNDDAEYEGRALRMLELCGFVKNESLQYTYLLCESEFFRNDIISTCNASLAHGERIRQACEESSWPRGSIIKVKLTGMYANVFCAVCNGLDELLLPGCRGQYETIGPSSRSPGPPIVRTATSLLAVYPKYSYLTRDDQNCPEEAWRHPEGDCRPLRCTVGKQFDSSTSHCVTPVLRVRGLGYTAKLLMVPVKISYQLHNLVFLTHYGKIIGNMETATKDVETTMETATKVRESTIETATDVRETTLKTTTNVMETTVDTATNFTERFRQDLALSGSEYEGYEYGYNYYDYDYSHYYEYDYDKPFVPYDCDYDDVILQNVRRIFVESDGTLMNITTSVLKEGECFNDTYKTQLENLLLHPNLTGLDSNFDTLFLNIEENATNEAKFLTAKLEAYIVGKYDKNRDTFETETISTLFREGMVMNFNGLMITFKLYDLSSKLHRGGADPENFELFGVNETNQLIRNIWNTANLPLDGLEHLFLPLNETLICPHLNFTADEFEVRSLSSKSGSRAEVVFPYYFNSETKPISFDSEAFPSGVWLDDSGHLVMCKNVWELVSLGNVTVVRQSHGTSLARQIVSVVCGSVSVVALTLTFGTYVLFPQLRALPGLNNMGLSGSLGLAQLSLLLPWHLIPSQAACRAVGVVTHWLWLMALGWMAICCLHMVRVFTSKTHHAKNERQVRKTFAHNVLATLLASTAVVVLTVSISAALSEGASIGYGGAICFLDTGFDRWIFLAFLVPLALMVLNNLVCFVFTVLAIVRVRRLQARGPKERSDVFVYVKLATVTGAAWLLGLVAELTDEEWVRVAAELFTAAQGLLLFLAYVCNARVWRLYRARFGPLFGAGASAAATTSTSANAQSAGTAVTFTGIDSARRGKDSVEDKKNVKVNDFL